MNRLTQTAAPSPSPRVAGARPGRLRRRPTRRRRTGPVDAAHDHLERRTRRTSSCSTTSPPTTRRTHPNVTEINSTRSRSRATPPTLTTQIAGGNAPDLAWMLETTAPDFVTSGALVPLDDDARATPTATTLGDLSASATKLWTQDGKLYAYPFSTSPFGVFVNNDLIKAAGQQDPGGADRRRPVDLGQRASRPPPRSTRRPARPAWSCATSTTRPGTTCPRSGPAGAPRRGAPTARRCGFDQTADGRRDDLPAQGDLHRQGACPAPAPRPTSSPATPP